MRGFTNGSVCLLVAVAAGAGACAQSTEKPSGRVIELTPKQNGNEIKLHVGDELALKLPIQAPFDWGLTSAIPELKEFRCPLKVIPVGESAGNDQAAGAPQTSNLRYRVLAIPREPRIEWVYCLRGRAIINGQPIKPTDPLKPGEIPTKRGTYFRIKPVAADKRP